MLLKQTQVTFANKLSVEASISWVDFEGHEHSNGAVGPTSRRVLQSFPGHAFRVRGPTGQLLHEVVVSITEEKGAFVDVMPCGLYASSAPEQTREMPRTMPHVEQPSKPDLPPQRPPVADPPPDRRTQCLCAFVIAAALAHVWPRARDFVRVRQARSRADKDAASVLAALAVRPPQANMRANDVDDSGDSTSSSNSSSCTGKDSSQNLRRRALAAATATTAGRVQLSDTSNSHGSSASSDEIVKNGATFARNGGGQRSSPRSYSTSSGARSGREEAFARADLSLKRLQEQQRTAVAEASAAHQRASAAAAEASRARAAALPGARQLAEQNQAFSEALQHDRSAQAQREAQALEAAAAKARAAEVSAARESADAARQARVAEMVASLPDEPPSKPTQTADEASSSSSAAAVAPAQVCCAVKVRLPLGRSSARRFPAAVTTLRQVAWWALHEAASNSSGNKNSTSSSSSSSNDSSAAGVPPRCYELCTVHPRKVLATHAELEGVEHDTENSNSPSGATLRVRVICMSNANSTLSEQPQQPRDLELNLPATASVADAKVAIASAASTAAQPTDASGGFQAPVIAQRLVFGGRVLADVELLGELARSPSKPADATAARAISLILTVNPKLLVSARQDITNSSSSSSSSGAAEMPTTSSPEPSDLSTEAVEGRVQGLDSTLEALGFVPSVLLVFAALDNEE